MTTPKANTCFVLLLFSVASVGACQSPPQVSFESGGRTKHYVLVPGRSYHFAAGDDGYFGIRFTLVDCQPWEDRCVGRPANESLIQLFKVEPDSAQLVVGFKTSGRPFAPTSSGLKPAVHDGLRVGPTD